MLHDPKQSSVEENLGCLAISIARKLKVEGQEGEGVPGDAPRYALRDHKEEGGLLAHGAEHPHLHRAPLKTYL